MGNRTLWQQIKYKIPLVHIKAVQVQVMDLPLAHLFPVGKVMGWQEAEHYLSFDATTSTRDIQLAVWTDNEVMIGRRLDNHVRFTKVSRNPPGPDLTDEQQSLLSKITGQ